MRLAISIAMCTFNGEQFLSQQLKSIAVQERVPDELVICDDGSSDNTVNLVTQFARGTAFPVRLVVNDSNLGSTKNFEKAISLCRGEIVVLADQDDIWYRQKLKRIEAAFLRSSEIVAVFSDADLIDDDSRPSGVRLWASCSFNRARQRAFANGRALDVLIRHPVVTGATLAFRRELFEIMAPFPPDDIHDRWMALLLAVRGGFEIIPDPLMQYRRHKGQQVGLVPTIRRERLEHARSRTANTYREEVKRFQELQRTLEQRRKDFPQAEYALQEIANKIAHFELRARLPRGKVARIPEIVREVVNGRYWRYSGGWISVAKDLIIR